MKRLVIPLLISLVLLATSITGCGQVFLKADLDAAREASYSEGYASGKADGYEAGLLEGNKAGYAEGYEAGLIELESAKQEAEKLGYNKGYEAGIAAARQAAQEAAKAAQKAAEAERAAAMARLEDLAYIRTPVLNYTDDADPEPEGISLRITFYDSKSSPIYFKDIPLAVAIKLGPLETLLSFPRKVYTIPEDTRAVIINSSGEGIRIPFEGMGFRSVPHGTFSLTVEVTVTTPNQDNFSVTSKGLVQW